METITFKKGETVFLEGAPGDCMYDVYTGKVGVYTAYGTPEQKLLMEYYPDHYFGEMGFLEKAPRSATAVAMEDGTTLAVITEESFGEFFDRNPANVLAIMQQMSHNLRRRTDDFVAVCRSIKELSEKEGVQ
ncbi:MAG: cyclic nucleotide-binding domain-containing protein [Clostridia bacterium]|nr:cyclic nucleotide-binding domain-containing protein [Oscillospiraceae bacterium]MBO5570644.1 cyclic nucleotide-binding domain-containing protein [Clostridia bacterium]